MWFNPNENNQKSLKRVIKSVEVLNKFLDEVKNEYNLQDENLIIGGFSQGAALSLIYSQYKKCKLGGIIILSGWILDINSIHILKNLNINIPIFIGHGTNDNIVLYENAVYLDNI